MVFAPSIGRPPSVALITIPVKTLDCLFERSAETKELTHCVSFFTKYVFDYGISSSMSLPHHFHCRIDL